MKNNTQSCRSFLNLVITSSLFFVAVFGVSKALFVPAGDPPVKSIPDVVYNFAYVSYFLMQSIADIVPDLYKYPYSDYGSLEEYDSTERKVKIAKYDFWKSVKSYGFWMIIGGLIGAGIASFRRINSKNLLGDKVHQSNADTY